MNPPIFDPATAALPYGRPLYEVRRERSVFITMRDGKRLSTDLYFPVGAGGRLPVILVRTPYDKRAWRIEYYGKPGPKWFASQGYVLAVQDKRGKFESEDVYSFCGGDVEDTDDTVEWLAAQPWSTGKVGMFGCSYLGEIQVRHAALCNPKVAAISPHAAGGALGAADGRYSNAASRCGGALELAQMLGWFRQFGSKINYRPALADAETFERVERFFAMAPNLPPADLAAASWRLPIRELMDRPDMPPTDWVDIMTHEPADPWWDRFGFLRGDERFATPALHINSWYDYGVAQTIDTWRLFQDRAATDEARDNQYLVIAPTKHCHHEMASENTLVGDRDLGDARFGFHDLYFRWYDRWLNGRADAMNGFAKVHYYLMGKNVWRASDTWPPEGTVATRFYLRSGGAANSRHGDGALSVAAPGDEPADSFVYDPATPVPSCGGPVAATGQTEVEGAYDQSVVEMRHDVLVYSTDPLEAGIEVSGPVTLELHVSSSAPDTDFTAKLVDVYPDGRAFNVQEGILRVRYREGFDRPVLMTPGTIVPIVVDLQATSNWFGPGHRIRIEVSSSNFPRFDRNLNTGGRNYDEAEWRIARNSVHHSRERPSCLVLPVRG